MPIFEFRCASCGHQFEALVRSTEPPRCPACESATLEKQLSVFAVSTRASAAPQRMAAAPCGSCGHPDGPGACQMN